MWELTLNKFPYYFEDGAKNYVLWYGNKNATKSEKKRMEISMQRAGKL